MKSNVEVDSALGRSGFSYQVYFNTSSIVVSPSKMLRNPSCRSVTMPSSIGFLPQDHGRRALVDQFANRIADLHQLVDSFAALVAGVVAGVATFAVVEFFSPMSRGESSSCASRISVGSIGRAAMRADAAQQALAEHSLEGRRNQKWLHAHVDQTRDRAGRVVRVQGGENKMAGERRLDGNLRRLEIARFTDHDAIGILAQKCAQDSREGQPDRFVHRHLHDSFEVVFDRFLRGQQFGIDRVDLAQAGIERRGFSRAGRAR